MNQVWDPTVVALHKGERPKTFGLNLNALWPGPRERAFAEWYGGWSARLLDTATATATDNCAYVYPLVHLHVTVATLCSFREHDKRPIGEEQAARLTAAWKTALLTASTMDDFPRQPFKVIAQPPVLEQVAAIITYEDPTGGIAAIRRCVARALQDSNDTIAPLLPSPKSFAIPSIVHTTVLRFHAQPAGDASAFRAAFRQSTQGMGPIEVEVDAIEMVLEDVPFMHIPVDAAHRLLTLPMVERGPGAGN